MSRCVTPEGRGRGEGGSGSDDRAVVRAPRVKGVAFESVPGLERLELAADVLRLRSPGREHRVANLLLRSRHLPDAQFVDASLGHEVPVRVAADAHRARRYRPRGLRSLEDEIAID